MDLMAGADLCGDDADYYLVSYAEGVQEWDIDLRFKVWYMRYVEDPGCSISCDWDDDDTSWDDDDSATGDDDDSA